MRSGAAPDDLVAKVLRAKDGVQEHLQIVAGARIAVEVDRSSALENARELGEPRGHHRQVGEHVALAKELPKRPKCVGNPAARVERLLEYGSRRGIPAPGVLERGHARRVTFTAAGRKEQRVALIALERRIEINQVDGLVAPEFAQQAEVVAAEESVSVAPHSGRA
jgi:hypothetical protein